MRVRRSLLNFGTSALFMAVTMAVALKATPWLVHWLGAKPYGGFQVLNAAYGYLTLLELGLGGALAPLMVRAIGAGDDRALGEAVAAGARAYVRVAVATAVVGLLLTPVIPWFARDLKGADVADLQTAWLVGLGSCGTLVLLPLRTAFEARQLGYLVNLLMTAQSLLITGTALVLARAGWGITGQASAQLLGVWAFSLALAAGTARLQPGLLRAAAGPVSPGTRRELRGLSVPTLLVNLSGRLAVLSDFLVVGGLRGTAGVTALANTQKLANIGLGVLQGVGGASWAALAELHARGDTETFNRRLVEMTRGLAVLAAAGLVPVVAYNRAFVRLWVGPGFYAGDLVTALAAVNAVLLAEQSLWAWCFSATGKVRELVAPAAAAAAVNLAASVALTHRLGVAGPLVGSTLGFVGVGLWALLWKLRRNFGTPPGALLRAAGVPCLAGAAAAAGLGAWVRVHEPAGRWGLVAGMAAAGLAMLAFGVGFLLTPEDRRLWRLRLRALAPAGRAAGAAP